MKQVILRALALAGLLAACSRDQPPSERGPATPVDPATAGTVAGVVRLVGEPPEETRVKVWGDAACSAAAKDGMLSTGDMQVHDGKLGGAFVYVASGLEGRVFERPTTPVVIDQRGCWYVPHVVGAETGQEIEFRNSDSTLHNVHTQPKNSAATNFGMSPQVKRRSIHIDRSEVMVKVGCDVHPWMRAFIGVLDHPYFAVTGADGAFSFAQLPPGRYTVTVWHERLGTRSAEVTLEPKGSEQVELSFGS